MLRRQLAFWGRHRLWAALLLALIALVGGATYDLLRIARDLDNGREAISGLQLDNLNGGLVPTIEGAAERLRRADSRAHHSPFLAALGVVPGIRTQVEAIRDLTDVGDQLGRQGMRSATKIDRVLTAAGGDASQRVALLDTVLEQLDAVDATIEQVHVGAGGRLLLPLGDAREKVVDELEAAPDRLEHARFYVRGLRRLLAGPSKYLVLAANNAEMRGGAGMPLSGGVVTISNGDIAFGDFVPLAYQDFAAPPVDFPASWKSTYYRWSVGKTFPETAVSPSFPVTAPIYEAMAASMGMGQVDGVIEVDAVALRNLLTVIGPVELDGVTYDADNVEQKVLNESYLRFDSIEERDQRQGVQAALAKRIFEVFKEREVPVADLALALRDAATGRHLLARSDDPAVQELWKSVGADGRLNPFGLMVAVDNIGANKLDWFVQPSVTLNVLPAVDGSWKGRLTVAVENPKPPADQTSSYVDGSYDGATNGAHRALVAVYLPQTAYDIQPLGTPFSEQGIDPPLYLAGTRITIPLGETVRVALEFSLPKDALGAFILPSGRVRPIPFRVNDLLVSDAFMTPVAWIPPSDDGTPGAPAVAGVLALAGGLAVLVGVRARLRLATRRPMRPLPDLLLRAPSFGMVLYVGALAVLAVGALISAATH